MERIIVSKKNPKFCAGWQGENLVTEVDFDLTDFLAEFGAGTVHLMVRRHGDAQAYLAPLTVEGSHAHWSMSAADLDRPGYGEAQLLWFVGEKLAKSDRYAFFVNEALGTRAAESVPDPESAYLDQVAREADRAMNEADRAGRSEETAGRLLSEVQTAGNQIREDTAAFEQLTRAAEKVNQELPGKLEQERTLAQQIHTDAQEAAGQNLDISRAAAQVAADRQAVGQLAAGTTGIAGQVRKDKEATARLAAETSGGHKAVMQAKAAVDAAAAQIARDKETVAADRTAAADSAAQAKSEADRANGLLDDTGMAADRVWSSLHTVDMLTAPAYASGPVAVMHAGLGNYPADVISEIGPTQEGSGDPSPTHVRNFKGWTGARMTRCGANIIHPSLQVLGSGGIVRAGLHADGKGGIHARKGVQYTFSVNQEFPAAYTLFVKTADWKTDIAEGLPPLTFTVEEDTDIGLQLYPFSDAAVPASFRLILTADGTAGETVRPYQGEDFTAVFGRTVYGGRMHWKTGELVVTHRLLKSSDIPFYGENDPYNKELCSIYWNISSVGMAKNTPQNLIPCNKLKGISWDFIGVQHDPCIWRAAVSAGLAVPYKLLPGITPRSSYEDKKAAILKYVGAFEIAADLSEPITVQLPPAEVLQLAGTNTVFTDTGPTAVIGRTNPNEVVSRLAERIAALEQTIVEKI